MKTKLISLLLAVLMVVPLFTSFGVISAADPDDEQEEITFDNPFTDVPANSWFTYGSLYCYKYGYMSGTGDAVFSPKSGFTRAMFAVILYQIDMAEDTYSTSSFTDVKPGKWYSNAIEWAVQNGYSTGLGSGIFGPGNGVTREQLAVFLYTYSELKGYDVSNGADLTSYKDNGKIAKWARLAFEWAVAEGLISGTDSSTLAPKNKTTRAQIAVILANYFEKYGIDWGNGEVITERTCTTEESEEPEDPENPPEPVEPEVITKTVIYKAWHMPGKAQIEKQATCGSAGKQTTYCTVCGEKLKTDAIPATGKHSWNSGYVTQSATCTASGVMTYTCTVCSKTKTESIASLGHSYSNGKCTRCGASQPGYTPPTPVTPSVVGTWYMCGYMNSSTPIIGSKQSDCYITFYSGSSCYLVSETTALSCTYSLYQVKNGNYYYLIYYKGKTVGIFSLVTSTSYSLFQFVDDSNSTIYIYSK